MQKQINKLFNKKELTILKSLIGQKIDKIRDDRFDYTNTSFRRITFFAGNKVYELLNEAEETDFMWDDYGEEAVAAFKFFERGLTTNTDLTIIQHKSKPRLMM